MKIEKLPSGSYRMRKMYKGKMYTIVTDYKPTQKQAIQLMAEELKKVKSRSGKMTFRNAAEEYIDTKKNVLSPSTIRSYYTIIRGLSEDFLKININDIEQFDIQREINRIAKDRTPKTTRNYNGFISSVIGFYRPNMKISTTLPQKLRNEPYIPSDEDIKKILEHAQGTRYEVPLMLACYGMRRSEICALTPDDIEGDVIRINKAMVQNENKEWVIKSTKTTESTRKIIVPEELTSKIKSQGYAYNGHPNNISKYMMRAQDELGIEHFSLHKLRHYFASKMSAMHIPDADIMKMGGWKTDHVMKGVYRHAMQDKNMEMQREAANKLKDALF